MYIFHHTPAEDWEIFEINKYGLFLIIIRVTTLQFLY